MCFFSGSHHGVNPQSGPAPLGHLQPAGPRLGAAGQRAGRAAVRDQPDSGRVPRERAATGHGYAATLDAEQQQPSHRQHARKGAQQNRQTGPSLFFNFLHVVSFFLGHCPEVHIQRGVGDRRDGAGGGQGATRPVGLRQPQGRTRTFEGHFHEEKRQPGRVLRRAGHDEGKRMIPLVFF